MLIISLHHQNYFPLSAYILFRVFFLLQEYKISFTIDNIFLVMTFLIIRISRVIYSYVVKTMRDTQARRTHYFMTCFMLSDIGKYTLYYFKMLNNRKA